MLGRITIVLTLVLGLSACSTKLNPMNWFSGGGEDTVAIIPAGGFADSTDNRQVVRQITNLQILRTPGGAIIRVTGLPQTQGYWDAELVPENGEVPVNGVLTYVFRVQEPSTASRASSANAREVIVAHVVSNIILNGVRQIRVLGSENSRTARR